MGHESNPYGGGLESKRIVNLLEKHMSFYCYIGGI